MSDQLVAKTDDSIIVYTRFHCVSTMETLKCMHASFHAYFPLQEATTAHARSAHRQAPSLKSPRDFFFVFCFCQQTSVDLSSACLKCDTYEITCADQRGYLKIFYRYCTNIPINSYYC